MKIARYTSALAFAWLLAGCRGGSGGSVGGLAARSERLHDVPRGGGNERIHRAAPKPDRVLNYVELTTTPDRSSEPTASCAGRRSCARPARGRCARARRV